jgi:hypothetical protein
VREGTRHEILLPASIGLAAVAAPIILALVGVDYLNTRNLLVAMPPLIVALAIGLARAPRWRGSALAAALFLIFALVLALVEANPRYQRDDWRGASDALGATTAAARVIVVDPASGLIPMRAYQPHLQPMTVPTAVSEVDVVDLPAKVTGAGIGSPARPHGAPAAPTGFRLVGATYASTYTVLRFRSPAPVVVTSASVAPSRLGTGPFAALVQRP